MDPLPDAGETAFPIAVAFFVSPTRAVTALHTLTVHDGEPGDVVKLRAVLLRSPSIERSVSMRVVHVDVRLDYAVMVPMDPSFLAAAHLTVCSDAEVVRTKPLVLLTLRVKLAEKERAVAAVDGGDPMAGISFTLNTTQCMSSLFPDRFEYTAQAFAGDSGGAVVVSRSGEVVGLHVEIVNTTEHPQKRAKAKDTSDELMSSVSSLVSNPAHMCVAARLDVLHLV